MMWNGDGWSTVMWISMALFWVAVIGGFVWLTRSWWGSSPYARETSEILDQRLASGEIEVDEHRRLKAELALPASRSASGAPAGRTIAVLIGFALAAILVTGAFAGGWDMWGGMGGMHGGGRDTSGNSPVPGGMTASVTIEGFAFQPGNLEIPVGATVTWTNRDSAPHDATARNGDWRTQRLSDGENDTLTFESAGEYDYYCSIHPSMKARLVVR